MAVGKLGRLSHDAAIKLAPIIGGADYLIRNPKSLDSEYMKQLNIFLRNADAVKNRIAAMRKILEELESNSIQQDAQDIINRFGVIPENELTVKIKKIMDDAKKMQSDLSI